MTYTQVAPQPRKVSLKKAAILKKAGFANMVIMAQQTWPQWRKFATTAIEHNYDHKFTKMIY